jgi:hypothetical protein
MDKFIRLILVTVACVAAQSCADHPTTAGPVRSAQSSAPAPAPEITPPANAVPATANAQQVVLDDKTLTQSEVNELLSQGYKPKKGRGDEVLYCRSEQQMGSRFEKKVCLTGDQIKTLVRDSKDETKFLQRDLGNPGVMCASVRCT